MPYGQMVGWGRGVQKSVLFLPHCRDGIFPAAGLGFAGQVLLRLGRASQNVAEISQDLCTHLKINQLRLEVWLRW
jgi:hypothetical protein